MESESKRIIFKRIYVWKLALFGLVWGVVVGLIFWPVTTIVAFFNAFQYYIMLHPSWSFSFDITKFLTFRSIFYSIIYSAILGFLGGLVGGVIYNLLSRMGINLNWDLAEA